MNAERGSVATVKRLDEIDAKLAEAYRRIDQRLYHSAYAYLRDANAAAEAGTSDEFNRECDARELAALRALKG